MRRNTRCRLYALGLREGYHDSAFGRCHANGSEIPAYERGRAHGFALRALLGRP